MVSFLCSFLVFYSVVNVHLLVSAMTACVTTHSFTLGNIDLIFVEMSLFLGS
jgi:uncharacterized protein YqfA (UPF0365 family)